jgi:hypothetical protein
MVNHMIAFIDRVTSYVANSLLSRVRYKGARIFIHVLTVNTVCKYQASTSSIVDNLVHQELDSDKLPGLSKIFQDKPETYFRH